MGEHLIAFINGHIAKSKLDPNLQQMEVGSMFGTSVEDTQLSLQFGRGYHDIDKVIVKFPQNDNRQMDVKDAVDHFMAFYNLV